MLSVCSCASNLLNSAIETKPLSASSSNMAHMSVMMRGYVLVFKVKATLDRFGNNLVKTQVFKFVYFAQIVEVLSAGLFQNNEFYATVT